MGLYQIIIEKVEHGASCKVDFKNRELRIDGKVMGLTSDDLGVPVFDDLDEWLDYVEDLYDAYKYSRPSKTSINNQHKGKFKALTLEELVKECGHDALLNPKQRNVALAELEVFILFSLLNDSFNPDELFAKDWFFQGADKSLVITKNWF